jgi:hypothetical protein
MDKQIIGINARVIQLVHRTKPREIWYLRAFNVGKSENVENARRRFAEIAKKAKG